MMFKINHSRPALFIFFTVATLSASSAFADVQLPTELGFQKLESSSTPAAVKKTADSVFEVRLVYEADPNKIVVMDLTDPKFKDIDQKVDAVTKLDANEKTVIKNQIQRCRRDGIDKQCPVFFTMEKATAFLVGGDGSYLLTNAHVVNGFLKMVSALQNKSVLELLKSQQRILIYLFDQSGKLIFDPYLNQANVIKYGEPSQLAIMQSSWYAEDSDYAVLKLSKVIGQPLKVAKSFKAGEVVYHTGFAACTGCDSAPNTTDAELNRDRSPKPNSTGVGYYWTAGNLQSAATARAFINADWYLNLARLNDMLFFNADAQVGMSGGPILNQAGEVVGVFAGSKQKVNPDGSMSVLSRGVRPTEFNSAQ
jgi:hypothetical protein